MRIGIDLGGTKIAGIAIDSEGTGVASARLPTPRDDYDATLAAIVELVGSLRDAPGTGCRIGIGTPGAWDPANRRMKNCNSTWLNGRPLFDDLRDHLGALRLSNDANCFALAEARDGAASDAKTVFGVILGTGVGGGIVIDGVPLLGANAIAGEWGHTPLPYFRVDPGADRAESGLRDRACYCGRANCIETFLSGPGLARTDSELWDRQLTPEEVVAGDDAASVASLSIYSRMLARSLAQVINLLDPDVIVLGGGLSAVDALYAPVRELCAEYTFTDRVLTSIRSPAHGAASGARGAAYLWPANYTE